MDDRLLAAWPPAAVATMIAAALALVGTLVGVVWSVLRSRLGTRRAHRTEQWERAVWAAEMVCSDDVGRREIGRDTAASMYEIQRTSPEVDPLVIVVLEMIRSKESRDVHPT